MLSSIQFFKVFHCFQSNTTQVTIGDDVLYHAHTHFHKHGNLPCRTSNCFLLCSVNSYTGHSTSVLCADYYKEILDDCLCRNKKHCTFSYAKHCTNCQELFITIRTPKVVRSCVRTCFSFSQSPNFAMSKGGRRGSKSQFDSESAFTRQVVKPMKSSVVQKNRSLFPSSYVASKNLSPPFAVRKMATAAALVSVALNTSSYV